MLLVDDIDEAQVNTEGKNKFLRIARNLCDMVIVSADAAFSFEELAYHGETENPLLSFKHLVLNQFGHLQRHKLIERWLSLGQEYQMSEEELSDKLRKMTHSVDTVIQERMLPSHPMVVLMAIEIVEASIPPDLNLGWYGYVYEYVITRALATSLRGISPDMKCRYLSEVAYYLFARGMSDAGDKDLAELTSQYHQTYQIKLNHQSLIKGLVSARFLVERNGRIGFRYPNVYYYFVARYLRDNLQDSQRRAAVRKIVRRLCQDVYRTDSYIIVQFLTYLSPDPFVRSEMLRNSRELYKEEPPCDLVSDSRFIIRAAGQLPELEMELEVGSQKEKRERRLAEIDKSEVRAQEVNSTEADEEMAPDHDLCELVVSIRTIQLLGQTLRNFGGSLRGPVKVELTEECYMLGLRIIGCLLVPLKEELPEHVEIVKGWMKEADEGIEDDLELDMKARQFVLMASIVFTAGIVKTIAFSAGSEILQEIYDEVLRRQPTASVRLIDVAIKLEHFKHFPEAEVLDLHQRLEKELLPWAILRFLVYDRLNLYYCDHATRQRICARLRIKETPAMIGKPKRIIGTV